MRQPHPHPLAGIYAAAVTPLHANLGVDPEAVVPLLEFLADRGCHGALLFGTTGEGPSFAAAEREAVWRAALAVRASRPGFRLLAGTGTPSLQETVDLTHLAFDLGYDGVVTLPPYYFRKASDDGLFAWFAQVIQRAVPADGHLLGYHFPGAAGIGFSLDLLARLKQAFPVQFAGIKDSSHDAEFAQALGTRFGTDLLVLNGTDSLLIEALEAGAGGAITAPANLISPDLRALWDAWLAGGETEAIRGRVVHARHALEAHPPFPPMLKALLHSQYGMPHWPVRPPLEEARPEAIEMVNAEFVERGL